jgi:two-component system, LuxR family, response regulator FixJ
MLDNGPDHVAIVDDDPAVLASLRSLLQASGYRVRAFASAAAFLGDQARRAACLILDHHMPKMTGLELVAQLRTAGACTPVLIVTGLPSPSTLARAAQLGVERVVSKPLRVDDLLSFVNAHY